jgi:peptidoglycan/xylan/chitin deacetylase (PgdA/CDA1 family)
MVSPPKFIRSIFSSVLWNIHTEEKVLYLTFDDGPNPKTTPWIVDELKKYNAFGTFFCVGENMKKYPDMIKLLNQNKHTVSSHGYYHINGWFSNTKKYVDNCLKGVELTNNNLFRPPHGKLKLSQYYKLKNKVKLVLWDVLSYDFNASSANDCVNNIITHSKKGSIIVFHENEKSENTMKESLSQILLHYSKKGFVFKNISKNIC